MKPIEPGCLCVVFKSANPKNIGKVVTPIEFVGSFDTFEGNDLWLIEETLIVSCGQYEGEDFHLARESQLIRIDGGEFSHETEQEEIGVTA